MMTKTGKSALPEDFSETLLKVFQTSSVPAFNALFEHFSIQTELTSFTSTTTTAPTIDQVLKFAESRYRRLCSTNSWTGVATKANKTSFKACLSENKGETICFNCGGSHSLKECPRPHNEERIKTNKKIFWEVKKQKDKDKGDHDKDGKSKSSDKKSKKDSKSKWAPPTKEEQKNKNRRLIDGKEYFYRYRDKRWILVRNGSSPVAAPAVAPGGNVAEAPAAPQSAPSALPAAKEVALVNVTCQVESALRGLLSQF